MSQIFFNLAQFTFILWPLFILVAFVYSFFGSGTRHWLRSLLRRIYANLLWTWLALFLIWIITLFAGSPTPGLIPEPWNTLLFLAGVAFFLVSEARRLRIFPARIHARMDLHTTRAVSDLRAMNPAHFEELVAETYRGLGYRARRTGHSGDHGIDVELRTPQGERWIVQCKRYRDSVGEGIVRELYGTLVSEKAERAVLVTSAEITPPAESWARGKPIDLIDGRQFYQLMLKSRRMVAGSPFDRFTTWMEQLIYPLVTPSALRVARGQRVSPVQPHLPETPAPTDPTSNTQPVRVRRSAHLASTNAILCPSCGAPMIEHPARPNRGLYRCQNYPACRAVISQP
jgi:restriction system protein